ncbi:hypothetical protein RND71_021641 [Anisodus tanguticus]|uniref:HAT C-terminal dimerisation domain-containing protein n=1 Tax=Anisodus tanguticus TaxID=243964 RepID=A0AAE1RXI9_9SOLA|nr:hypothetical protein RND71_021641 [Anisodus tanguticus]
MDMKTCRNTWRGNEKTFPTLSLMARDVLNIQASSTGSESAFSAGRYQIGDHKHSLAGDSLKIVVLFRDWIRAERRRCGQPEINEEEDENYNEILTEDEGNGVVSLAIAADELMFPTKLLFKCDFPKGARQILPFRQPTLMKFSENRNITSPLTTGDVTMDVSRL